MYTRSPLVRLARHLPLCQTIGNTGLSTVIIEIIGIIIKIQNLYKNTLEYVVSRLTSVLRFEKTLRCLAIRAEFEIRTLSKQEFFKKMLMA